MIAYLDSSVLGRAYLADEDGHCEAAALLDRSDLELISGRLSRIEVSGALVRAGHQGRADTPALLEQLDGDLAAGGRVMLVTAPHERVEDGALRLVRQHGLRALDALHLSLAQLVMPQLASLREPVAFTSRDAAQATVARELGFESL